MKFNPFKHPTSILGVLVLSISAVGQINFLPPTYSETEGVARIFISGDFDNDGLNDICYYAEGASHLSILFNDGSDFTKIIVPFALQGPSIIPIASGDFNKDGKDDIALFNNTVPTSQKIAILTSQGRNFTTTYLNIPQTAAISKRIIATDFDKDGNTDLICASDSDPFIYYFRGNGSGGFVLKTFTGFTSIFDFKIADLNGDGVNDIVTVSYDNNLNTYLSLPNDQFTAKSYTLSSQPKAIGVADFNGDSYPEIIVSEFLHTNITYYQNNNAGNFIASSIPISDGLTGNLAIGDYNNDNALDIVAVVDDPSNIILLRNIGDHSFVEEFISNANTNVTDIGFVELNNESNPELVSLTFSKTIDIYTKQSLAYTITKSIQLAILPLYAEMADLDNDTNNDLVIVNFGSKLLTILSGETNGTFSKKNYIPFNYTLRLISLGDFNTDGYTDIAYTADHNNDVRETGILLSDGAGGFSNTLIESNPSYILKARDFNQDGKLDLLIDNKIYIGDGGGNFLSLTNYALAVTPSVYLVEDFNSDGAPDLIIGDGSKNLYIHYNNGTGTLQNGNYIFNDIDHVSISSSDLNNDGNKDVVVATGLNSLVLLINQPDNTFIKQVIITTGTVSSGAIANDFNLDGKIDIALTSTPSVIDILQQTTSNVFEKVQTITLADAYGTFFITDDLNRDQKSDLVFLSLNGKPLTYLINDSVLEPTTQSSGLLVDNVTDNSAQLAFAKGNGQGRLVVIRKNDIIAAAPVEGQFYTANPQFGQGAQTGSSNFVLLRSDANSVNITGLSEGTAYNISIYEYNVNQGNTIINYLLNNPGTTSFITKKNQTITPATLPAKSISDVVFQLPQVSSSNLPITIELISGGVTLDGTAVTILTPGPAVIKFSQPGNNEYMPATDLEVTFCVNPLVPTISITATAIGKFLLTSSSNNNNIWSLNGVAISGATNTTYEPTVDGVYTVKVDFAGCTAVSLPTSHIITRIDERFLSPYLSPNPTAGIVTIQLPTFNLLIKDIFLVDLTGKKNEMRHSINDDHITLDLSDLPTGLYYVVVQTDVGILPFKVLKK